MSVNSMPKENKMGTMPVKKLIFNMALPLIISMLIQALYNIVDSIFVSRISEDALTAVSLVFPVQNLMIAFATGTGVGMNALLSRRLGEKNREAAEEVANVGLLLSICTAVVFALFGVFGSQLYFSMQKGVSPIIAEYGAQYLSIVCIGSIGIFVEITAERMLQGTGQTLITMFIQGIGAIINIILDPILITTVGWGARGAAIATIVGYLCSDLYFLWLLHKKSRCLSVKLSQCHVTGRELQQILGVGVTAALSNLMQSLTVIVMNQFLLPYGNDKIAAMGIASKVSMIAQLVLVGFSFGGIPLFGYLYGAKKRDVMRKLIRFCLTFLVSIAVVLSLILCLNSGALMRLFVQDAGMIATGAQMLRWQVYTAAFGGVVLLLTVLFQATGKIVPSFLLSISRQGVVFLLALVVCVHLFQYQGVLMAQAVADILSAALALGLLAASRDIIAKQ